MDLPELSAIVPMESSPYSSPSPPYAAALEQPPLSPYGYRDDLPWIRNSPALLATPPYTPDYTPWFDSPTSPLDMPRSPGSSPPYSPTSPIYSPSSLSPPYSPKSPVSCASPGRGCCDVMCDSPSSPQREDDGLQFHPPSPEYCYCCSAVLELCECPPSPPSPWEDDLQFRVPSPEYCYCCSTALELCECPRSPGGAADTACASGSDVLLHGEGAHE